MCRANRAMHRIVRRDKQTRVEKRLTEYPYRYQCGVEKQNLKRELKVRDSTPTAR